MKVVFGRLSRNYRAVRVYLVSPQSRPSWLDEDDSPESSEYQTSEFNSPRQRAETLGNNLRDEDVVWMWRMRNTLNIIVAVEPMISSLCEFLNPSKTGEGIALSTEHLLRWRPV